MRRPQPALSLAPHPWRLRARLPRALPSLAAFAVLAASLALVPPVSTATDPAWRGAAERPNGPWTWEILFASPRRIGSIGQVLGDHPFVLRHAPRDYEWQSTQDGVSWSILPGTVVQDERRRIRVFRFPRAGAFRGLRLVVRVADFEPSDPTPPTVAQLDLLPTTGAPWPTAPWILVVNSTDDPSLPGHGQEFIPLAQSCPGWESLSAQQVWVPELDPELVDIEPKPLAVFLSGSFKDWCEVDRRHWKGAERVLKRARDPIWASCGGAQALAILADRGTSRSWDCPHCRDPLHPRLPIYSHIGHRTPGHHSCGDYADCVFERGPHEIRTLAPDPVFAGLPENIQVMESHCGQIEYAPRHWDVIATGGTGTLTMNECLRLRGRPVYAAQFHIEMAGTPKNSRTIMANFLELARHHRQFRPVSHETRTTDNP